jgi:mannose-6-phosphate isomerase-like protein (cupin superfamily)
LLPQAVCSSPALAIRDVIEAQKEIEMAEVITAPAFIEAAGTPPKRIEEFIGRASSGFQSASVARMVSPSGWAEPGQRPEFEEISLVLAGVLVAEFADRIVQVKAGQALRVGAGEWVRYSTPTHEGAQYISICLPAFAADLVNRDPTAS